MILTPGAYLKHRRTAADLAIEDVAARVATDPHLPELDRTEWLKLIEADAAPLSFATVVALRQVFPFDIGALELLTAMQMGFTVHAPVLCRICACSYLDPCKVPGTGGCFPAGDGLCSACAAHAAGVEPAPWAMLRIAAA